MIIFYIEILPWVFTSIFEDYYRYFDRTAHEKFISISFLLQIYLHLQWSSDHGKAFFSNGHTI